MHSTYCMPVLQELLTSDAAIAKNAFLELPLNIAALRIHYLLAY